MTFVKGTCIRFSIIALTMVLFFGIANSPVIAKEKKKDNKIEHFTGEKITVTSLADVYVVGKDKIKGYNSLYPTSVKDTDVVPWAERNSVTALGGEKAREGEDYIRVGGIELKEEFKNMAPDAVKTRIIKQHRQIAGSEYGALVVLIKIMNITIRTVENGITLKSKTIHYDYAP